MEDKLTRHKGICLERQQSKMMASAACEMCKNVTNEGIQRNCSTNSPQSNVKKSTAPYTNLSPNKKVPSENPKNYQRSLKRTSKGAKTKLLTCFVCNAFFEPEDIKFHLAAAHPEIYFTRKMWKFIRESRGAVAHFNDHCRQFLRIEMNLAKRRTRDYDGHEGQVKKSSGMVMCAYCNDEWCEEDHFNYHMLQKHFNDLEKKLTAYCKESELEKRANASENGLNEQSTLKTKVQPLGQQNIMFEGNADSHPGKHVTSTNGSGLIFNSDLDPLNRENLRPGQVFAQKAMSNITNTGEERNSCCFATAAPIHNESSGGKDSRYGNVFQGTALETGPNMSRDTGISSMVSSRLSLFTKTSNHLTHLPTVRRPITESSNPGNMLITNQLVQQSPTIMTRGNSQLICPPVPLVLTPVHTVEQQQVKSNQTEMESNSSQFYSVHPSFRYGLINDVIPEWDADLPHILTEYPYKEAF